MPGFERAVIVATSPAIGVRESRRVHGDYRLTREDVLGGAPVRGRDRPVRRADRGPRRRRRHGVGTTSADGAAVVRDPASGPCCRSGSRGCWSPAAASPRPTTRTRPPGRWRPAWRWARRRGRRRRWQRRAVWCRARWPRTGSAGAAGRRRRAARAGRRGGGRVSASRSGRFEGRAVLVTGSTGMAASAAQAIAARGRARVRGLTHGRATGGRSRPESRPTAAGAPGTSQTSAARRGRGGLRRIRRAASDGSTPCTAWRASPGGASGMGRCTRRRSRAGRPSSRPTPPRSSWSRGRRCAGCSPRSPDAHGSRGALAADVVHPGDPSRAAVLRHPCLRRLKGAIDALDPRPRRLLRAARDPGQRRRAVPGRHADEPARPGGPGDPALPRREAAAGRRARSTADAVTATALHLLSDEAAMVTGQVSPSTAAGPSASRPPSGGPWPGRRHGAHRRSHRAVGALRSAAGGQRSSSSPTWVRFGRSRAPPSRWTLSAPTAFPQRSASASGSPSTLAAMNPR